MEIKFRNNGFVYTIIGILIAGALDVWMHRYNRGSAADIKTMIDTLVIMHKDTVLHKIEKHYISSTDIQYLPPTTGIDTPAVIKAYYTRRLVRDSIADTLVKIFVTDTLQKNQVIYRKYDYRFLKPYQVEKTITKTEEITRHASGFYAGPFLGAGGKTIASAGLELDYVTRRNSFGAGVDIINKSISGKILFKLGK